MNAAAQLKGVDSAALPNSGHQSVGQDRWPRGQRRTWVAQWVAQWATAPRHRMQLTAHRLRPRSRRWYRSNTDTSLFAQERLGGALKGRDTVMNRAKSHISMALLAASALIATSFIVPASAADELRIGFIAPKTGIFAQLGTDMQHGFQMYLDEHNGELGGAKVTLIVEDDQGKPDTGVTKANKLILSDKVHMLVGGVLATTGYALAPVATREKMLYIGSIATADAERRPCVVGLGGELVAPGGHRPAARRRLPDAYQGRRHQQRQLRAAGGGSGGARRRRGDRVQRGGGAAKGRGTGPSTNRTV